MSVPALDRVAEIFEQFKAYGGSAILVGEVDSILAASCTLVVVPNLTRGGRSYALIENVVTHHDFRSRGFGKQLLLAASDAARQVGCYKVMLMTGSKKPETISFYLGAGFEQTKTGFQKRCIPVRSETTNKLGPCIAVDSGGRLSQIFVHGKRKRTGAQT